MNKRLFTFRYGHESSEWTGDVFQQVDVTPTLDGTADVTVTTSLLDERRRDEFDRPTGRIVPHTTPRGTTRYEYLYPSGHSYPGFFPTVREAAQAAASYATATLVRKVFGNAS